MSLLAPLIALALMAGPTVRIPADATLPSDGGDLYVLADGPSKLYVAWAHPMAFEPGRVRAVTVATINKTPEINPEGRLQSYEYMGLTVDCARRTAVITGYAAWDETESPMVIYGGMPESQPIQPNTPPDLAAKLMCEGKGTKTREYLFQVLQRWRSTGNPL